MSLESIQRVYNHAEGNTILLIYGLKLDYFDITPRFLTKPLLSEIDSGAKYESTITFNSMQNNGDMMTIFQIHIFSNLQIHPKIL